MNTPPAPSARNAFGGVAPKLAALTDDILFGEIWARPGLSPRDRSLITVAALVALYRDRELAFHLTLAVRNGLSLEELIEAITHLAFYAGWPNATAALAVARQTVLAADTP